ncbi:hypothetical protein Ple7327_1747 [Pleurocapsa sp. PCC 7327]|nr:hypothetical protein [Pleurocapsa sp. PCC 7327]AFY77100.1 hypothetical protein Ple7327_1747 [Pleurocapsa sp. PCC 7327]
MKRTVSIPVNFPHERFVPLMGFCAEIFNRLWVRLKFETETPKFKTVKLKALTEVCTIWQLPQTVSSLAQTKFVLRQDGICTIGASCSKKVLEARSVA